LEELKAVAKEQTVEFEVGDILLIRCGYIKQYHELERTNPEALVKAGCENPTLAGVEQTEDMKTWLHDWYVRTAAI
jgi:xanthine dehydrogenase iron-sulfur cluster and FAD-binding subunit A